MNVVQSDIVNVTWPVLGSGIVVSELKKNMLFSFIFCEGGGEIHK